MLNSAHFSASSFDLPSHSLNKTMQKASGYAKNHELGLIDPKCEPSFERKSLPKEYPTPKSFTPKSFTPKSLTYSSSSDLSNLDLISPESETSPPSSDGYDLQKVGYSRPPTNLMATALPPLGVSAPRQYSPMFIQHDNFSSPFHSPSRTEGSITSTGKKDIWSSGDFSDISPPQLSLDFLESGRSEPSTAAMGSSRRFSSPRTLLQKEESPKSLPPISRPLRRDLPQYSKDLEPKVQHESHRNDQRRRSRYGLEVVQPATTFHHKSDVHHYLKQSHDEDLAGCLSEIDRLSLVPKKDTSNPREKVFASTSSLMTDSSLPVLRGEVKPKSISPRAGGGSLPSFHHERELEFQDSQSSESDEDSETSLLATQPLPNLNLELEEESQNRSWQAKRGLLAELYKTEICLNWLKTRNCSYGNKCHYAHGIADLRARQRIETYKTQPCADPARKGCHVCMYTSRCNYAHPGEPIRRLGPHSGKKYFDHEYFEALRKHYPYHEMPFGVFV
jgi:hypothetical protein